MVIYEKKISSQIKVSSASSFILNVSYVYQKKKKKSSHTFPWFKPALQVLFLKGNVPYLQFKTDKNSNLVWAWKLSLHSVGRRELELSLIRRFGHGWGYHKFFPARKKDKILRKWNTPVWNKSRTCNRKSNIFVSTVLAPACQIFWTKINYLNKKEGKRKMLIYCKAHP